MATVEQHYDEVLSNVYSWMYGGLENNIQRYAEFFSQHQFSSTSSGIALDLGAGCGFQSIPLARAGYAVTAIDLDAKLLNELKDNADGLDITTVQGDLLDFEKHTKGGVALAVCMTDTILHLASREDVSTLFDKVFAALDTGGKFVVSFRDMTYELEGADRFLPVRSDEQKIFTCFLEYEEETVKVHDILYQRIDDEWQLSKSFYRKLRLSQAWMSEKLLQAGFREIDTSVDKGMITMIVEKAE